MQITKTATRAALAEFTLVFLGLIAWVVIQILRGGLGHWESLGDALITMRGMCTIAFIAVSTTISFAAITRSVRHRIGRWLTIIPAIIVLFLLLFAINVFDIVFTVVSLSAGVGLCVGLSRRWSPQFQEGLLSTGAVALIAAFCLGKPLDLIWTMQWPIPIMLLVYSTCIAGFALLLSRIASHRFWRLAVSLFSILLVILLLQEPFLPLLIIRLSPSTEYPYIEGRDPIKIGLLITGIVTGVANGRNGYFHALKARQVQNLFVIGTGVLTLFLLLGWEYSVFTGMHEITVLLGATWLFTLIFIRPSDSSC